ncbi:MAG: RraA family protein [Oscillibacter sp.]|nr:RraA family protein [Oscillibacter sp.]
MAMWANDDEMFQLMREKLYTPVVGDILDKEGYGHQFLPASIRPLEALAPSALIDPAVPSKRLKIAGYACTVLEREVFGEPDKPFGYMTEALDQLQPNEIYVATGAKNSALWGELLTATARTRGAVGAVLDGYSRDTPQVLEQNFPVFCSGCWAQDSSIRSYVCEWRRTIEIGQVVIQSGDLIFGDVDGVLVIPREVVTVVLEKALIKAAGEKNMRNDIENGMSSTEAFAKYGIL